MFKRFLICVSVLVFIFTQVSFFCIPVSAAELPTYNLPDLDNYTDDINGAIDFVGDCYQQVASGFVSGFCDAFCYPLDESLHSGMEQKFGIDPFSTIGQQTVSLYDRFRDWYLNHGSNSGGGGYRDGSQSIDTNGSYSWNYPVNDDTIYLDDGCGGFITVNCHTWIKLPYYEYYDLTVYYRGQVLVHESGNLNTSNTYPSSVPNANPPKYYFGIYSVEGSATAYFYYFIIPGAFELEGDPSGSYLASKGWNYTQRNIYYPDATQTGSVSRKSFTIRDYSNPTIQNNSATFYSYNPTTNSIENNYFYGADENGQPCLYDTDNNIYNFNSDGTLGNSHCYLVPDFSTLNDNDKIELTNLLNNYYMSVYLTLLQQKNTDNSDILPFLTSLLDQLMGINSNTTQANSWLRSINSSVITLDNDNIKWLKAINDTILSLNGSSNSSDYSDIIILLTELKKGLLGTSDPYKPDQIISLLEQIAKNTSPDPENIDELPIDFQFDYYVQSVPDMLRDRLDVSSYFKQLKNIFSFFFNDNFLSDINFDEYFNTQNYMGSSDSSVSAVYYSTSDYPEVFGEELAQQDVDISSSVYLTASVYSSGSTIEGSTIPAPYLEVNIMGHTYNLFEYLTPEVYDKIKPLKNFISLVLYAFYFLWVVRSVIPSLFSGSNLDFYSSTSKEL